MFEHEKNGLQYPFHAYLEVTISNNACKLRLVRPLMYYLMQKKKRFKYFLGRTPDYIVENQLIEKC